MSDFSPEDKVRVLQHDSHPHLTRRTGIVEQVRADACYVRFAKTTKHPAETVWVRKEWLRQ